MSRTWHVKAHNRLTGKTYTYEVAGALETRCEVAAYLAKYFPGVETLTIDKAK